MPAVKARLARIYGILLEKHLRTAEYYDWKGYPRAAAIYYRTILKDEASFRRALPDPKDYPVHEAVRKSRARVSEDAGYSAVPVSGTATRTFFSRMRVALPVSLRR